MKTIIKEKQWDQASVLFGVQDEGRFGRINSPRKSWCLPKDRPQVAKQVVRQSVVADTFVCPEKAKATSLILPYANTEMMNLFLEQVAKDFKESKIIMQVDQARWHQSKDLKIPENIVLIEQPPYSPELHPVEQIEAEVREKFLDNQLFETLEDLKEQRAHGLKEIAEYGKRLTSLTNFPHLRNIIQKAN